MSCIICKAKSEKLKFEYQGAFFKKCTICGLVRTLPFPPKLKIINHYRDKFKKGNYKTLLAHMNSYSYVYKGFIRLLKRRIGNLSGKRILDVGCFTADFLDLAKKDGAVVYGIELQKEAYEIARKKHGNKIKNCSFEKASFKWKFDIITMFGLIEHTVHPDALIESAVRWLKKDGILIIQTPNTRSILAKILGKFWPPYVPIEHIHYFSDLNIKKFLRRYGFSNIKCTPHIKFLTLQYLYDMLETFGSEFRWMIRPFLNCMPQKFHKLKIPLYGGEMLVTALKAQPSK